MAKLPTFNVVSTVAAVGGGLILLKDHFNGPTLSSNIKLENKNVIITGANRGIGREVVKELADKGAKIIMACRDFDKCESVRKEIVIATKNPNIVCKTLNLASLLSIKTFVDSLSKNMKIDYLINNAAIMNCPKAYTQDGFESHFGVNYLGHFYLTTLLLTHFNISSSNNNNNEDQPKTSRKKHAKIINVIDKALKLGHLNLDEIENQKMSNTNFSKGTSTSQSNIENSTTTNDIKNNNLYDGLQAYRDSKYAIALWSQELASILAPIGVKVYCVDPGLTNTDLHRYFNYRDSALARFTWKPLFEFFFMKDIRHGAQNIVYAILNDKYPPSTETNAVLVPPKHANGDPAPANPHENIDFDNNKIIESSSKQSLDNEPILVTNKNGKFIQSNLQHFDPTETHNLWEHSIKWVS